MQVRVGHSPDPDDAFMVWAIAERALDLRGLEIELVPADIQTLNGWAAEGRLEATALSVGAYPGVQDAYRLLGHGASLGEGYGPVVIAREPVAPADLAGARVAVPGPQTTAFLTARLALPAFEPVQLDFEAIMDAVRSGDVAAGVVIHEGQLTWEQEGFSRVLDLGAWWEGETGMPLPLGAVAIRRDLPEEQARDLSAVLREAVRVGMEHREEALAYAIEYGRGIAPDLNDRFVAMYVNDLTLDYGERGRAAVAALLERGHAAGLLPGPVRLDFLD
ncbi:MAG: 1,4-dihydroxy-6-naphtoate synthase [Actinomycetota bacterium]|jgi:1,4-dihydroxy-6-naphthoate synthase